MKLPAGNAFGWVFHVAILRKGEILKHLIDTSATLIQMSENEFIMVLSGELLPINEENMNSLPYTKLVVGDAPYSDFPNDTIIWEKGSYTLHQAITDVRGFCVSRLQNNLKMPKIEKVILAAGDKLEVENKLLFLISGELAAAKNIIPPFTEVVIKNNAVLHAVTDCIGVFFSEQAPQ